MIVDITKIKLETSTSQAIEVKLDLTCQLTIESDQDGPFQPLDSFGA